ncbi:MAG: S16 family serine protease [Bacilli bacterium]|nr:S16 family serine protease [Bacilli bacterium]
MKEYFKENLWFIIILIIIVALFNIRLPYYINMPGGTIEINDRIECKSCKDINGSLNLLYVSEYEATVPTYLLSLVMSDWDIEKVSEQQVNNETMEEIYNRNKIMLEESIDSAVIVAYKESNKEVNITNKKNIVIATTTDNNIKIGDEIIEVDGKKVENVIGIRKIISSKNKGDKIGIKVIRKGEEKVINTVVSDIDGNKMIGVVVSTDIDYEIDPKIKLKFKSSEAGASGGLMLALSIYSKIADEDIIKGRRIAGTGTIESDGTVGEIDGVKYKIMGADKDNIDLVFVPSDNYKEAIKIKKKKHYKMKIVKVDTFEDAVKYLKDNN